MKKILLVTILCLSYMVTWAQFPIDFSRVGYMWGEKPIPEYENKIVLKAPEKGSDMTAAIQKALDKVQVPGAVLLTKGVYNVSGPLVINRNGVVLRGEGEETVIVATGTEKRTLLTLGEKTERVAGKKTPITADMTPVGQMWVKVKDPSIFSVGDRVAVRCKVNDAWVSGLRMDVIPQNNKGSVKQWTPSAFAMKWERFVMKVEDDRIWLDNPVVMELDARYLASAWVEHVDWERISQSGVENLKMISEYDPSAIVTQKSGIFKGMVYNGDENHAWSAIDILSAEHCWIRNVTSCYFAHALVNLKIGSKNITVSECVCSEPVSMLSGARRDAFHLTGGELCLVERCRAEHNRHGFQTAGKVSGPNVILECDMTDAYADAGPHQRWASGVLYDSCVTDDLLAVQDRGNWGTGHGWAGVSFVFWNCRAASIICQSPWINGKNWCIGCIGEKASGRPHKDNLPRPDGEWISHGIPVQPVSLYRHQLSSRVEKVTELLGM